MNVNLVVMPGSPALVRELAPGDAAGARLRGVLRGLLDDALDPPRRIELVSSRDPRWYTALTGSLQAWGAPQVTVGAGNHLPELIQRYVLGERAGTEITSRASLGAPDPAVLTIVAVDGSAGLDPRAPLAELAGAEEADHWCRAVLAAQSRPRGCAFRQLTAAGIVEPDLWLELAALSPQRSRLLDADTTLGVGRYVAAWDI